MSDTMADNGGGDVGSAAISVGDSRGTKRSASPLLESQGSDSISEQANKRVKTDDTSNPSYSISEQQLDENGCVPAYQVDNEPYPKLAFYHASFGKAECLIREACNVVIYKVEELKISGWNNEQISNICGEATLGSCRNPSNFYPRVEPCAVLGPAGSGKSSAINSIMNTTKVAFEHDGDDRGTYVVHEYRDQEKGQTAKYLVQVPYYSIDEIMKDVFSYQAHIMQYLFLDEEMEDQDGAEEEGENAMEQKYKTALDFFCDVLCDRPEFQTTDKVSKWFEKQGSRDAADIGVELTGYIEAFINLRDRAGDRETFMVNSEDELSQICKQVSRPSPSSSKRAKKPSPWGVIRNVSVHQDTPLLRQGLVLADTPGINDQNLTVVANTRRYLKVAGTILVFLSYKRIQQNSPLDQLLRECIALGKMHSIVLVVTMIDNMATFTEDQREDLDDDEAESLEAAKLKLKTLESRIRQTEKAKKEARGKDNDLYAQLDEKIESLELQKTLAATALKQVTINIRCMQLKEKLKNRLREIDGSKRAPELPIMFISNSEYQKHLSGYDSRERPQLDITATGIPALRQHLLTLPTRGKLQNLKGLASNRLPNILNGMIGILTKSSMERKYEVRSVIEKVVGHYEEPVISLTKDIMTGFQKLVVDFISKNEQSWRDASQELIKQWGQWNTGTVRAVCVRSGEWENNKTHGNICWNADIQKIYAAQLTKAFNKVDDALEGIERDFSDTVSQLFEDLQRGIENSEHAQGQDFAPFFLNCRLVKSDIVEQMSAKFEELKKGVSLTRYAATLATADSYSARAMEKTYEACVLCRDAAPLPEAAGDNPSSITMGSGRRKRKPRKKATVNGGRMALMTERFQGSDSQASLFQEIGTLAKDDLRMRLKAWGKGCNKIIKSGYDRILDDFDGRFQDPKVKEEEEDPDIVEQLRHAVSQAMDIVNGPLKERLWECEEWEKSAT